jgi:sugar O-acyltransferase (sialic acid O-acetyltransferase NeuD family)
LVRAQIGPQDQAVFIDDMLAGRAINGAAVLTYRQFAERGDRYSRLCIAIADGAVRKRIADQCEDDGLFFFSVRPPNMLVMDDVEIGDGALFSPFTTVTSNVRIGRHFHCNLYSYVEHDCTIGDFVTFAPSVCCNGNISIGDCTYVGAGAIIKQGVSIGEGATIGMGAVVTKDVPAGEVWVGNPARCLQS